MTAFVLDVRFYTVQRTSNDELVERGGSHEVEDCARQLHQNYRVESREVQQGTETVGEEYVPRKRIKKQMPEEQNETYE